MTGQHGGAGGAVGAEGVVQRRRATLNLGDGEARDDRAPRSDRWERATGAARGGVRRQTIIGGAVTASRASGASEKLASGAAARGAAARTAPTRNGRRRDVTYYSASAAAVSDQRGAATGAQRATCFAVRHVFESEAHVRLRGRMSGVLTDFLFDTCAPHNYVHTSDVQRLGLTVRALEVGEQHATTGFGDGSAPHLGTVSFALADEAGRVFAEEVRAFVVESGPTIINHAEFVRGAPIDRYGSRHMSLAAHDDGATDLKVGDFVFKGVPAVALAAAGVDQIFVDLGDGAVATVEGTNLVQGAFAAWCGRRVEAARHVEDGVAQRPDGDGPQWALPGAQAPRAALADAKATMTAAQHEHAWRAMVKNLRGRALIDGEQLTRFEKQLAARRDLWRLFGDKSISAVPALCSAVHKIVLVEGADLTSIMTRAHRRSADEQAVIDEYLEQLKAAGRVRESNSPVSSIPVVAAKRNAAGEVIGWRVAIDFRRLNAQSLPDAYPVPDARAIALACAAGELRSTLDMLSQFWSVPLSAASVPLTATDFGNGNFYEWLVAPFGLRSMPATLQRWANRVFSAEYEAVYADDVTLTHRRRATAADEVMATLERAARHGVTFNAAKVVLFAREANVLGHWVGFDRVAIHPEKVLSVADAPQPSTPTALQRFCNRVAFFNDAVGNVATLLAPLRAAAARRGNSAWKMSEAEKAAYQKAVAALRAAAPLQPPRAGLKWVLQTDGSQSGLAYWLYQEDESAAGGVRLIQLASRVTRGAECRRAPPDLELTALHWALQHCGEQWLGSGRHFIWRCDNQPDVQALAAKATGRIARFAAFLQRFSFTPEWVSRDEPIAQQVDAFSYFPQIQSTVEADLEHVDDSWLLVRGCDEVAVVVRDGERAKEPQKNVSVAYWARDGKKSWAAAVAADGSLEAARSAARAAVGASGRAGDKRAKGVAAQREFYVDASGVLWRRHGPTTQLVVPAPYRRAAMLAAHTRLHVGAQHMFEHAAQRYWWPAMRRGIAAFAEACATCQLRRTSHASQRALVPGVQRSVRRGEVLTIDHAGLTVPYFERNANGETVWRAASVLVTVEEATRFKIFSAVRDKSMAEAQRALTIEVLPLFPAPRHIVADTAFRSAAFVQYCAARGIRVVATPPYSYGGRALGERSHAEGNRALVDLLDRQGGEDLDWDGAVALIKEAQQLVNAVHHRVIGMAPQRLLMAVAPRDALERALDVSLAGSGSGGETAATGETIVGELARWQENADEARRHEQRAYAARQRQRRATPIAFRVGDMVTVKWPSTTKRDVARRTGPWQVRSIAPGGSRLYLVPPDAPMAAARETAAEHCRHFVAQAARDDDVLHVDPVLEREVAEARRPAPVRVDARAAAIAGAQAVQRARRAAVGDGERVRRAQVPAAAAARVPGGEQRQAVAIAAAAAARRPPLADEMEDDDGVPDGDDDGSQSRESERVEMLERLAAVERAMAEFQGASGDDESSDAHACSESSSGTGAASSATSESHSAAWVGIGGAQRAAAAAAAAARAATSTKRRGGARVRTVLVENERGRSQRQHPLATAEGARKEQAVAAAAAAAAAKARAAPTPVERGAAREVTTHAPVEPTTRRARGAERQEEERIVATPRAAAAPQRVTASAARSERGAARAEQATCGARREEKAPARATLERGGAGGTTVGEQAARAAAALPAAALKKNQKKAAAASAPSWSKVAAGAPLQTVTEGSTRRYVSAEGVRTTAASSASAGAVRAAAVARGTSARPTAHAQQSDTPRHEEQRKKVKMKEDGESKGWQIVQKRRRARRGERGAAQWSVEATERRGGEQWYLAKKGDHEARWVRFFMDLTAAVSKFLFCQRRGRRLGAVMAAAQMSE